jgi:hypothetical protein
MNFLLREAWHEFKSGLKGGILPLIYVVLTGYILLVMTSADNLRNLGAVDVPRNAPALVYLMTSGMAFFLFFAWAWVFAQPIVRDRNARLHEIVLAAPRPLRQLLLARYLGALGVALVLGTSQFLGFWLAPVMEAIGAIPPGSVAAAPWFAFGWAFLIFTLPLAAGSGALYYVATLRTRSVGGAFAVSAMLMGFWMVTMIVLKEGHVDPFITALFDPSGFAEAERQVVDHWTPHEKRTALIALTPGFVLGRLIWGVLPLFLLAFFILRATRESLLHGKGEKDPSAQPLKHAGTGSNNPLPLPGPILAANWLRAALSESLWQARLILSRRSLWVAFALLTLLATAAAFVHGVQHAYGPMLARAEFISPMLTRNFYLIIAFMTAAMVGMAARRDEQPGLSEMFDAAPAPNSVRLAGRAFAALAVAVFCVAIPASGGSLIGLAMGVDTDHLLPFAHQMTVLLPAILELAATTLLLHAVIRHTGTAYAASMLAAFIMVINFEIGLVNYPPHQIGRGVGIALSGLTEFAPWAEKIILGDAFKLALVVILVALAAALTRRGTDESWRTRMLQARSGVSGVPGLVALAGIGAMALSGNTLHQRFVDQGGYETLEEEYAKNARWEKKWLAQPAGFSVAGGEVLLKVLPETRELLGQWQIDGVRVEGERLHALLPAGFTLLSAKADGKEIVASAEDDHLALELPDCRDKACTVELAWRLPAEGWKVVDDGVLTQPSWLVGDAFWLHAREVMPRLGLDGERIIRIPAERERLGLAPAIALPAYKASLASGAAAPAGKWQWRIETGSTSDQGSQRVAQDRTDGLLDFAAFFAPQAVQTRSGEVTVTHDKYRGADAQLIALDVSLMQACVARHLGKAPTVTGVAQWPRGLPPGDGDAALSGELLLLAEHPHWDVADKGVGRFVRRADIAAALARRLIADAADLREGAGGQWLDQGIPGALGLLCVAENDGVAALQSLLARGAQQTTEELAKSADPVTSLALAKREGWSAKYAPLAALSQASKFSPQDIRTLSEAVRQSGGIEPSLAAAFGSQLATLWLGPPNAVDLRANETDARGERWTWREGGWQPVNEPTAPRRLQHAAGQLRWNGEPSLAGQPSLFLDDWPAYEREPKDNRALARP